MTRKRNQVIPDSVDQHKWVITRKDVKLRVRHIPPPSAQRGDRSRAIFFVHGVAGSSDIWTAQLSYFSERGYHVIAPDLIGHGMSSAPNKHKIYTFGWVCHDCITVFDQFYQDINIVVGHSYGTSFAAYLARIRSSKIQKLVLMSGGAPIALAPQRGLFSLPSPVLSCIRPAMTRIFNKSAFHQKNKELPNKDAAFDVPLYVLRNIMNGQIWDDGDELFHKLISQPTLLLHGEQDGLEGIEGTQEMHNTLPTSEFYCIPDSSHMIMMEQPDIVNRLIYRFLDKDFHNVMDKILFNNVHKTGEPGEEEDRDDDELPIETPRSPAPRPQTPLTSRDSKSSSNIGAHHLTKSQPNLRKSTQTFGTH